jgi:hypothetical protein
MLSHQWRTSCIIKILRYNPKSVQAVIKLSKWYSVPKSGGFSGFRLYASISPPRRWSQPRTSYKSFVAELGIHVTSSSIKSSAGSFSPWGIGLGYF